MPGRDYAGIDDLRSMQATLSRHYDTTHLRPGDLAWLIRRHTQEQLTHAAHQRRGLARTVCLAALHALRDAGARTAQVSHASAAARSLYESLGFRRSGQDLTLRRPGGEPAGL
ncbi:MAG TPA: GNAT family N-acetyltransferase [Pseudonocardiaceae bacterium]